MEKILIPLQIVQGETIINEEKDAIKSGALTEAPPAGKVTTKDLKRGAKSKRTKISNQPKKRKTK